MGVFSSLKKEPEDLIDSEEDPMLDVAAKSEKRRSKIAKRVKEPEGTKRNRMNACMTYFAIMNGYTTMALFTLPIGFRYGGWLFSPLVLIFCCFTETFAAIRLIQAARVAEIYSYTDLVEFSLGKTYKYFFQIFVATLHFGYTLAMLGFFSMALKRIFKKCSGLDTNLWIWAGVTFAVFAPITWIRTLEVFQYGNVYSIIVVYLMIICITVFCTLQI